MKKAKKIKKREWVSFSAVALVIVIAFTVARVALTYNKWGEPYHIAPEQCTPNGYEVSGNTYLNTVGDANIQLPGINGYVGSFTLYFAEPLPQPMNITVYYAEYNHGYSEAHTSATTAKMGETMATLTVGEDVITCRIDIGTKAGETFSLEKISINEKNNLLLTLFEDIVLPTIFPVVLIAGVSIAFCVLPSQKQLDGKIAQKGKRNKLAKTERKISRSQVIKIACVLFGAVSAAILVECLFLLLRHENTFNSYRFVFWLAVFFILFVVFQQGKNIFVAPEKLFLVLALSAGLMMAIYAPVTTLTSWDDEIHYKWAAALSSIDGNLTKADTDMIERLYPKSFVDDDVKMIIASMDESYGIKDVTKVTIENIYATIAYVPMAVGLFIGRLLHFPYHVIFILGRITNLLFYVTVAYWAIKITPVGKRIMTVIALFPTTIFMAASYSYDPWITTLTMLWLALLFDEMVHTERKLTVEKTVLMLGIFVLACAPKQIYCALGLLFLMMPKEKFDSKKTQLWFYGAAALCAGAVALDFMLPFLYNPGTGDTRGGSDVNSTSQLGFVLGNPVAYTKILFNHIKGYLSISNSYEYTVFLAYLGGGNLHKLVLVVLAAVTISDRSEKDLLVVDSAKRRALVFFTLFATVCLISTALYISFTPVGLSQINGVQPRYLTPLVFPFLLFLGTGKLHISIKEEWYNTAVFLVSGVVLFEAFWTCCIGRYVV